MIGSPYFKVVDAPVFEPKEDSTELLCGDYWGIKKINDEYILNFISGTHGGASVDILISENEFEQLKAGKIKIEALLKLHGTG